MLSSTTVVRGRGYAYYGIVIRSIARALEDGRFARLRALERVWGPIAARAIVRPLDVPDHVLAITVGGATIGGSGKTTVAIACARVLAASRRVALIGHAYGARAREARVVRPDDALEEVGDEALVGARALPEVTVIVARRKQEAIDRAVREGATAIVLDGPLRVRAARAIAILAVDAVEPWSRGHVLPAGDLRARPADLLAAADHVVRVDASFDLPALPAARIGLFTALARPDRVVRTLAAKGVALAARIEAPDHGPAPPRSRFTGADVWLATPKCALHLEARGIPHVVIAPKLVLPRTLASQLVETSSLDVHATP
jgi:tetraacyldisaccharide-1-P 4'-kinase